MESNREIKIWIDLDNSPHVPLFLPIINELRKQSCKVVITARDFFETCDLIQKGREKYIKMGGRFGRNKLVKLKGSMIRAIQLYKFAYNQNFSIAVGHGTRPQFLAAALLGIPVLYMFDYEHGKLWPPFGISKFLVPEYMQDDVLIKKRLDIRKVVKYPGLKEDIYSYNFQPDPEVYRELDLDPEKVIIIIRPPASEAFYHNPAGDQLFEKLIKYFIGKDNLVLIIIPRTDAQKTFVNALSDHNNVRIVVPDKVIDGLNLIWHSDLVISGGGTMSREAISLGVPAYSIFLGRQGSIDGHLERIGKLIFLRTCNDFKKIIVKKRNKISPSSIKKNNLVALVTNEIISTFRETWT